MEYKNPPVNNNCHAEYSKQTSKKHFKLKITSGNFQSTLFNSTNKMEFKVRKESQTLMEKVFNAHERRGHVRAYQIGSMLRSLNPELCVDPEELKSQISVVDTDGAGNFDFENFNRVVMPFLLRQSRRDSDAFIAKHEIGKHDFPTL